MSALAPAQSCRDQLPANLCLACLVAEVVDLLLISLAFVLFEIAMGIGR